MFKKPVFLFGLLLLLAVALGGCHATATGVSVGASYSAGYYDDGYADYPYYYSPYYYPYYYDPFFYPAFYFDFYYYRPYRHFIRPYPYYYPYYSRRGFRGSPFFVPGAPGGGGSSPSIRHR